MKPHQLVIDFACDPLEEAPRQVDIEAGDGHGGTLRLYRLVLGVRGTTMLPLRAVAFDEYCHVPGPTCGLSFARADVAAGPVETLLPRSHVALLARLHDVPLYEDETAIGLGGISIGSADAHLAILLRDGMGHRLTRRWTGYPGTDGQEERLPVELAHEAFRAALGTLRFEQGTPSAEDQDLFLEHFHDAWAAGTPHAWVANRFLKMAAALAPPRATTTLAQILAQDPGTDTNRLHTWGLAIDAAAAVTRVDLRRDAQGKPRPPRDVARDYVDLMGRSR